MFCLKGSFMYAKNTTFVHLIWYFISTSWRSYVYMPQVRLAMGLYFPYGMGQGLETLVSLRRIQRFLMLEEKGQSAEPLSRRGSSRSTDDAMLRLADVRASWISTILPSDVRMKQLCLYSFIGSLSNHSGRT